MKHGIKYWIKSIGELVFLLFLLAITPILSLVLVILTYLDRSEGAIRG